MTHYHLAQLNIATLLAPLDSPQLAEFVANLDRINALAEGAPGFIWRLKDDAGNATALRPFGDDVIVNMSVWNTVDALHAFAFRSGHVEVMRRRREWFARMAQAYAALWWVPAGTLPTVQDAAERLTHLRAHGPSAFAFTFQSVFPPPDGKSSDGSSVIRTLDDTCPA